MLGTNTLHAKRLQAPPPATNSFPPIRNSVRCRSITQSAQAGRTLYIIRGSACPLARGLTYGWRGPRRSSRCQSSWSSRRLAGCAIGCSSTVEVPASPPAVRLRSEQAFQLHQTPDPGAVGAEVGLDVRGRLADGGQVDAEQLRAPFQRRRDRPAQVRVLPSPHRDRLANTCSGSNQECYLARPDGSLPLPLTR